MVSVLFSQLDRGEGEEGGDPLNPGSFGLVENWRKIERPLGPTTKLLRVWQAWGEDKTEATQISQIFRNLVEPIWLKYYSHQNVPPESSMALPFEDRIHFSASFK